MLPSAFIGGVPSSMLPASKGPSVSPWNGGKRKIPPAIISGWKHATANASGFTATGSTVRPVFVLNGICKAYLRDLRRVGGHHQFLFPARRIPSPGIGEAGRKTLPCRDRYHRPQHACRRGARLCCVAGTHAG